MANITISDLNPEQIQFQEMQELDNTEMNAVVGGDAIIIVTKDTIIIIIY